VRKAILGATTVFGSPVPVGSTGPTMTTVRKGWSRKGRATLAAILATLVVLSSPGMAEGAVQENLKIPLAGEVIPAGDNPCNDENLVHTAGYLHILITYTENQNRISGTALFQPQGAKLEGATSGDEYVGTGMFMDSFNVSVDDQGAATFTFVSNFRIIGKGTAPNLLIHELGHVTFNPDGTMTAEINSASVECK